MISETTKRLIELLRNNITDVRNRGEDKKDIITSDGSDTITLNNDGLKNVYYIKNNTKGTTLTPFDDYKKIYSDPSVSTDYPKIKFRITPDNNDKIEVKYHTGQTWIYPDYPKESATFPRISIVQSSGTGNNQFLGRRYDSNNKSLSGMPAYEIQTWVSHDDSFQYDGEYYAGGKLVDFNSDEIINTIETNRDNLKGWRFRDDNWNLKGEIKHIRLDTLVSIDLEEDNFLRRNMDYEVLTTDLY